MKVIRRFLFRHVLSSLVLLASAASCVAAGPEYRPYDEKADAHAAIAAALADNPDRQPILLTFGANWCSDSRALEGHYQSAELAPLLAAQFKVLHIDVGVFHRNMDIVAQYGNPIEKGIPAVVVLQPDGRQRYASNHGELSSAGSMSRVKVVEFFQTLVAPRKDK